MLGAMVAHLLAIFSAPLGDEALDSPAVSAVRREVAGRIALPTSRATSCTDRLRAGEMELETGIDAVASLL